MNPSPIIVSLLIIGLLLAGCIQPTAGNEIPDQPDNANPVPDATVQGSFNACQEPPCKVLLVIDPDTASALAPELERLENDLRNEGYLPERIVQAFETAEETKTAMQRFQNQAEGALLIGEIPFAHMAMPGLVPIVEGKTFDDGYPSDNYYADIHGYCIQKNDFYYLQTACQTPRLLYPFIWIGRLYPTKAGNEGIEQLRDYLNRNHAYRTGAMVSADQLLVVVQDNIAQGIGENVVRSELLREDQAPHLWQNARFQFLLHEDTEASRQAVLQALQQDNRMIILNVHGSNQTHGYGLDREKIEQTRPNAFFVDLKSCSTANAISRTGKRVHQYLAGQYLFEGNVLLVKASPYDHFESIPMQPELFQQALAMGRTAGEAMRMDWQGTNILLGDPTLRFAAHQSNGQLMVSANTIDLGTITFEQDYGFEGDYKTERFNVPITLQNTGSESLEIHAGINAFAEGLANGTPTTLAPGETITLEYHSYHRWKIINSQQFVPENGRTYTEPIYILSDSHTTPIVQINLQYTARVA